MVKKHFGIISAAVLVVFALCLDSPVGFSAGGTQVTSVCERFLGALEDFAPPAAKQNIHHEVFRGGGADSDVAGDDFSGGFESTLESMSIPMMAPRGFEARQPPQVQHRAEQGWGVIEQLIEKIYPNETAMGTLQVPANPFQLHTRTVLTILSLVPNKKVPRKILEKLQADGRATETEIRQLQDQIHLTAQELGQDYRPAYYTQLVTALEEVKQSSQLSAGTQILDPLSRMVMKNSEDYFNILSHAALLDEAHSELLSILIEAVLGVHGKPATLHLDGGMRAAVEEVLLTNLKAYADPISDQTMKALLQLTEGHTPLGPELASRLRASLDQVTGITRDLTEARASYGSERMAAAMAYSRLSVVGRPDAEASLEITNLLKDAWVASTDVMGDRFPLLKEIILTALADSHYFYHPGLRENFEIPAHLDTRTALGRLGKREADTVIFHQVHTLDRMEYEFTLAQKYALQAEAKLQRSLLSEKQWQKIEKKLEAAAQVTVQHAIQDSTKVLTKIPEGLAKDLSAAFAGTDASKIEAAEKKRVAQVRNIPADIEAMAKHAVRMPWKPAAPAHTGEIEPYAYFWGVLEKAHQRAVELAEKDRTLQRAHLAAGTPISAQERETLSREYREVLQAISDLHHALANSFLKSDGGADAAAATADAEATMAWHLNNFPLLRRVLANQGNHLSSLAGLHRRLILQSIATAQNPEGIVLVDPKDTGIAGKTKAPLKAIVEHKVKSGFYALAAGAGVAVYYFNDIVKFFQHFHH